MWQMVVPWRSSGSALARLLAFTLVMSGVNVIAAPGREPVTSTSIASIGYDPERRLLDVEFRSGAIYRYLQVPREVASRFIQAESKGRFFARNIRGKFAFQQLRP